jgi:hypothetical protein
LPGSFFASAMKSFTLATGGWLLTTMSCPPLPSPVIGTKSLSGAAEVTTASPGHDDGKKNPPPSRRDNPSRCGRRRRVYSTVSRFAAKSDRRLIFCRNSRPAFTQLKTWFRFGCGSPRGRPWRIHAGNQRLVKFLSPCSPKNAARLLHLNIGAIHLNRTDQPSCVV